jgi:hypothetical protein
MEGSTRELSAASSGRRAAGEGACPWLAARSAELAAESLRALLVSVAMLLLAGRATPAQVRVNPTGVSVNVQGATTVFLTFGGLRDQVPVEAQWCGALVSAAPAIGLACDPNTLYGRLPLRSDLSRVSGTGGFTDVMSIPASVARRAYIDAREGKTSSFFYVRRFASTAGGPDEFVAVTCRLSSGGARTPLALTNVALAFDPATPVLFVKPGETPPPLAATIAYNGTGRLKGRWEIVLPGEELPNAEDLLTEATLPLEARGTQRRYTQLERFNVFLPPNGGGAVTLRGPDPTRLPVNVDGAYLVLLRIEASDDREGDSDLGAAGAGAGILHTGAVAGFPMPVLRYVVGAGESGLDALGSPRALRLLLPRAGARLAADSSVELSWMEEWRAGWYEVEIETVDGTPIFGAVVRPGVGAYRAPSFLAARAGGKPLRWRVRALDPLGTEMKRSAWRRLEVAAPGTS